VKERRRNTALATQARRAQERFEARERWRQTERERIAAFEWIATFERTVAEIEANAAKPAQKPPSVYRVL